MIIYFDINLQIRDGHRLELYTSIPEQVRRVIHSTLATNPSERPTMEFLLSTLEYIELEKGVLG